MKGNDLPGPTDSLADWVNSRVSTKADFTALSVSCQVLTSELFEELDVITSELTSIGIPKAREALADLDKQLGEAKSQTTITTTEESASSKFSECLRRIADLSRARTNIEAVKARLQQETNVE